MFLWAENNRYQTTAIPSVEAPGGQGKWKSSQWQSSGGMRSHCVNKDKVLEVKISELLDSG